MLFSKKNIYNQQIKCVASEVVIDILPEETLADNSSLLFDFIEIVNNEGDSADTDFHIIISSDYHECLKTLPEELRQKLSFKLADAAPPLDTAQFSLNVTSSHCLAKITDKTDYIFVSFTDFPQLQVALDKIPSPAKVVVTHVTDYQQLDSLKSAGVRFFSGEFIEKPPQINQAAIPANKTSVLKLISALNDPDADLAEVSQVIMVDNILSYKLLRIVNSPIFRGVNELNSIQDAIVRFGFANLKKWVLMLSLCGVLDKPKALLRLAIERALMCENLAELHSVDNASSYYTAGLISTLDAFLEYPMADLLRDTALADNIKRAILHKEGDIGETLQQVIDYQHAESPAEETEMTKIYIKSAQQTTELFETLGMN